MRFFRQALIGLTLLTLSVGILSYAGYLIKDALSERLGQEARVPQPRERTFAVNVVTAEPKAITPQLEAFGEIKSRRTLDLRLALGGLLREDPGRRARGHHHPVRLCPVDRHALVHDQFYTFCAGLGLHVLLPGAARLLQEARGGDKVQITFTYFLGVFGARPPSRPPFV